MIFMLIKSLKGINFTHRYKKICKKYCDVGVFGREIYYKDLLNIYKKLNKCVKYESIDKLYVVEFKCRDFCIEFCTKLHRGLVQPYFFIRRGKEKLYFDRFDFIAREIDSDFGEKYNIPVFYNEKELKKILEELLLIYEDLKKEFLQIGNEQLLNGYTR